jgi:hypothetical protein
VEGQDKAGRPVVYIFAQRHDKDNRDISEMKKYIILNLEKALKQTRQDEEKMIIVFDLSGFGLRCMDYEVLKLLIDILGYNYPETLSTAFVVNSPFIFSACWAIIRPWLDPVTAAKAQFIDNKKLLNFIDDENLAIEFKETTA